MKPETEDKLFHLAAAIVVLIIIIIAIEKILP